MKKFLNFIWVFLGFVTVGIAQFPEEMARTIESMQRDIFERKIEEGMVSYNDIMGTPYYHEKFQPGIIFLQSGRKFEDVQLNYDMYHDEFAYLDDGKLFFLGNQKNIEKIIWNDQRFKYEVFEDDRGDQKYGYMILLVEGKCDLYKRTLTEFKESTQAEVFSDSKPARFERQDPVFYLRKPSMKSIVEIRTLWKKRFLKKYFPDKQDKLLKMIRENDINIRNEEGLIKFVNLYNAMN